MLSIRPRMSSRALSPGLMSSFANETPSCPDAAAWYKRSSGSCQGTSCCSFFAFDIFKVVSFVSWQVIRRRVQRSEDKILRLLLGRSSSIGTILQGTYGVGDFSHAQNLERNKSTNASNSPCPSRIHPML